MDGAGVGGALPDIKSKSWNLRENAEEVARKVREEMEGVADLAVPLVVDVGWGRSWYEAKP